MSALASAALLTLLVVAPLASVRRISDVVVVAEGEMLADDLMAVAQEVRIAGRVVGDVLVLSDRLSITGTVEGDVVGFVRSASIEGQVSGSVRLSGGTVEISGQVGGDATTAVVRLGVDGSVGRDVYALGAELEVGGTVGRDVAGRLSRRVVISGGVGRDLEPVTPRLLIAEGASVGGTVVLSPGTDATIAEGADLGAVTERRSGGSPLQVRAALLMLRIVAGVAFVLVGMASFWLFPRTLRSADERLRTRPLATVLWGLLVTSVPLALAAATILIAAAAPILLAAPALAALVPVTLVVMAIGALAVLMAPIPFLTAAGRVLLRGKRSPAAGFVVAAVVFWILLAVPVLGGVVAPVAVVMGMGAWAVGAWKARGEAGWAFAGSSEAPATEVAAQPADGS